jgi:thiol-disulfide isomerase/thioredoxin
MRGTTLIMIRNWIASAVLIGMLCGCKKPGEPIDFKVKPIKPGGDVLISAKYSGQPILVYQWATWCGPCREIAPTLNAIASEYSKKGVGMLAVAQDDEKKVIEYEARDPHQMDTYVDTYQDMMYALPNNSLPTFYILDKQHRVVYQSSGVGPTTESELRAALEQVVE